MNSHNKTELKFKSEKWKTKPNEENQTEWSNKKQRFERNKTMELVIRSATTNLDWTCVTCLFTVESYAPQRVEPIEKWTKSETTIFGQCETKRTSIVSFLFGQWIQLQSHDGNVMLRRNYSQMHRLLFAQFEFRHTTPSKNVFWNVLVVRTKQLMHEKTMDKLSLIL